MELRPSRDRAIDGAFPDDWRVVRIAEIANLRTGPFGSALHKSDYTIDGVPLVNPMHIVDGRIEPTRSMSVTDETARRLAEFRFHQGDIVVGRRGEMGRCAVIGEEQTGWLCGTGSMIVRPHGAEPRFLQLVLSSRRAIAAIQEESVGTTMVNLNQSSLGSLLIQLPQVDEQRAIADALSDVDALLDGLTRLIAKKRDLKLAAMQQLLTGRTRLPGFSGAWATALFGDVAVIRNEKVIPSSVDPDLACIELEHIEQANGRLFDVSTAASSTSSKYRFFQGDVLFGRLRPYLRKYWLADRVGLCSTEIWPLIARHGVATASFLFALVQTDSFIESASASYGTHMPRADWGVIRKLEIRLPALDEQAEIATVLADMDAELAALEARRAKTQALKHAMMEALLTGRIRLVSPEPAHA